MAGYKVLGNVHVIGQTQNIPTKSGSMQKRRLTLQQRRFNQDTGEEYEPNYPTFEFSNAACQLLDQFHQGERVQVTFDLQGVKYTDKNTGEEQYMNFCRAYKIERYIMPQQQAQPQQQMQAPPQQMAQQMAPPQQSYYQQQPPQQQYQPQGQQQGQGGLPF